MCVLNSKTIGEYIQYHFLTQVSSGKRGQSEIYITCLHLGFINKQKKRKISPINQVDVVAEALVLHVYI